MTGQDAKHNPHRRRDDGNASEDITRLRTERARPTHAAQGAGETTTATTLDEYEQDQKDRHQGQNSSKKKVAHKFVFEDRMFDRY
jgi:hypothetical protein